MSIDSFDGIHALQVASIVLFHPCVSKDAASVDCLRHFIHLLCQLGYYVSCLKKKKEQLISNLCIVILTESVEQMLDLLDLYPSLSLELKERLMITIPLEFAKQKSPLKLLGRNLIDVPVTAVQSDSNISDFTNSRLNRKLIDSAIALSSSSASNRRNSGISEAILTCIQQTLIPTCSVHIFGSSMTGLSSDASDLDITIIDDQYFGPISAARANLDLKNSELSLIESSNIQLIKHFNQMDVIYDTMVRSPLNAYLKMKRDKNKWMKKKTNSDVTELLRINDDYVNELQRLAMKGDVVVDDDVKVEEEEEDDVKKVDDDDNKKPDHNSTYYREKLAEYRICFESLLVIVRSFHDIMMSQVPADENVKSVIDRLNRAKDQVKSAKRELRQINQTQLDAIKSKLRKILSFKAIVTIAGARVPLIKIDACNISHRQFHSTVSVDIVINRNVGLRNSELISQYIFMDNRVRYLLVIVKRWAKQRGICDGSLCYLSSYAFSIMALHYCVVVGIVPDLQSKQFFDYIRQDSNVQVMTRCGRLEEIVPCDEEKMSDVPLVYKRIVVDRFDTTFGTNNRMIDEFMRSSPARDMTLLSLVIGFFNYYSSFQYNDYVITLGNGKVLKSKYPRMTFTCPISIEDPFETFTSCAPHDLGCNVTFPKFVITIRHFQTCLAELSSRNDIRILHILSSAQPMPIVKLADSSRVAESKSDDVSFSADVAIGILVDSVAIEVPDSGSYSAALKQRLMWRSVASELLAVLTSKKNIDIKSLSMIIDKIFKSTEKTLKKKNSSPVDPFGVNIQLFFSLLLNIQDQVVELLSPLIDQVCKLANDKSQEKK